MLSEAERKKKLVYKSEHIAQRCKERKHLFVYDATIPEMWKEIVTAIRDPQKGIIVEDKRENTNSTHICIFVSDVGKVVAVPMTVSDEHIIVRTIKDVHADESNPNWFIRGYNEIAVTRNMQTVPLVVRPSS